MHALWYFRNCVNPNWFLLLTGLTRFRFWTKNCIKNSRKATKGDSRREAKHRGRNKGINCRFILAQSYWVWQPLTWHFTLHNIWASLKKMIVSLLTENIKSSELNLATRFMALCVECCRDGLSKLFPESLTACFMNTFGMLTKLFRYRPSIMRQLMKIKAVVRLIYKPFYPVVVRLMNATWWMDTMTTIWCPPKTTMWWEPCSLRWTPFNIWFPISSINRNHLRNILECNHSFHGSLLGSILRIRTMNFTYNALLFYMGSIRPNPPCDFGNVNIDQATLVADFKEFEIFHIKFLIRRWIWDIQDLEKSQVDLYTLYLVDSPSPLVVFQSHLPIHMHLFMKPYLEIQYLTFGSVFERSIDHISGWWSMLFVIHVSTRDAKVVYTCWLQCYIITTMNPCYSTAFIMVSMPPYKQDSIL